MRIELSHYLYFLYNALFAIFLAIRALFRKRLHRKFLAILNSLDQIDRSKVAFSNLFDRFELLMKSYLIQELFEMFTPSFFVFEDQGERLLLFGSLESEKRIIYWEF